MKLTNAMEQAVKNHLHKIREEFAGDDSACRCPLCRADTLALALSSVTPRYWTRRVAEIETDPVRVKSINEEVSRAIRHVEKYPKHPRGRGVPAEDPIWVVNFPLEESFRTVESLLQAQEAACRCWKCRCDAVAFALNRYPARYGVEHDGRTHLFDDDREQMRRELSSFLGLAIQVVSTVPRH